MYAIVIFKDENSVAIVPMAWLVDGPCVNWPTCSSSKRTKLCRKGEIYEGSVKKLHVEIYGFADTLKAALAKERKALSNSNVALHTHEDTLAMRRRPQRAIKKRKRILESSSSCSSVSQTDQSNAEQSSVDTADISDKELEPFVPEVPSQIHISVLPKKSRDEPLLQSTMIRNIHPPQLRPANTPAYEAMPSQLGKSPEVSPYNLFQRPGPSSVDLPAVFYSHAPVVNELMLTFRDDLRRLVELNQQTQQRLTVIEAKVDRLLAQASYTINTDCSALPKPANCKADFDNLEIKLSTSKAAEDFKKALCKMPGATLGQFLRNALGRIVTNNLARQMNVSGQNGKLGFKGTVIMRLLTEFLHSEPRFTGFQLRDVHQIIREWLHNSRKRTSLEVRRSEPRASLTDTNGTF